MCKIVVRVPTDQYAFVEPTFESIDKYVEEYPRFIKAFLEMQETVKQIKQELKEEGGETYSEHLDDLKR